MNERNKGAVLSYVQVILNGIITIIYVPVLLHCLGQDEYGLYQMVGSFFSYVSVFESSMSMGVLRSYCNALGIGNDDEAETTLSMARGIYRYMAVSMAVIGIFVVLAFRSFYTGSLSDSEIKESSAILALLFVNMMVTLLGAVYLTIITGHEKFIFQKVTDIIMQAVQPFLVIFCVRKIPYAITISAIVVILNVITIIIRYVYVTNILKIRITKKTRNTKKIKEIILASATILFGCIADQIFWKTDQVILGKMFNTSVVAIYSVGVQINSVYSMFGIQIASVFYSRIDFLYHEKDGNRKLSDLFIKVGRITFMIILLILSGFIVFGKEFLLLWVGEGYTEAYYSAIIVMIPFSVDLSQHLGLIILQMKNLYGFRSKIYCLSAVINIFTTVIFASYFGIIGAAVSTGLSMLLTSGIIMNRYFMKKADLDIKKYWRSCSGIILAAAVMTISALAIKHRIHYDCLSFISLMSGIALYTAVYIAIILVFVLNRDERQQIRALIKRK